MKQKLKVFFIFLLFLLVLCSGYGLASFGLEYLFDVPSMEASEAVDFFKLNIKF